MNSKDQIMEKVINLCKRRGFVIGSSEIYGGVASIYDFGPLGTLLKKRLKDAFWQRFVTVRQDMEGIESSIIMHPRVWEASGHLANFSDPLVQCEACSFRFREDHIPSQEDKKFWQCPKGGRHQFGPAKQFNLMFKTYLGATEESADISYLRPETAQGMFVNFSYVADTMRKKIPFGIAQIGKSFRNELGLGNYIFRVREFEIAEIEYFVAPGSDDEWFKRWVIEWENFLVGCGIDPEHLRRDEKSSDALAHYSKATTDLHYQYPWGWDEIAGIANRTDFDLSRHMQFSGKDMSYFDAETQQKFVPYVIEPTLGIERLFLAVLCEAYQEFPGGRQKSGANQDDTEIVLDFKYQIAPISAIVLPLAKKEPLRKIASQIVQDLGGQFQIAYDESGSIGRRYRRGDEIGIPLAITVDFDSEHDQKVTVRDRRTMEQVRVGIDDLMQVVSNSLLNDSLTAK